MTGQQPEQGCSKKKQYLLYFDLIVVYIMLGFILDRHKTINVINMALLIESPVLTSSA